MATSSTISCLTLARKVHTQAVAHSLLIALLTALPWPQLEARDVLEPSVWLSRDVGQTGMAGSHRQEAGQEVVSGSGTDIWGAADGFHFVSIAWEGDVEIIARVLSVERTDPWAKAGVMIRADLSAFSAHGMVAMTPEQGSAFLRRSRSSGQTRDDAHQAMRLLPRPDAIVYQQRGSAGVDEAVGSVTAVTVPRWVRLVRRGDVLIGFDSADGLQWEWLGTDRVELGDRVYVGLAVTSHEAGVLCQAVFDEVTIQPAPVEGKVAGVEGTGDGLAGRYFASMDLSGPAIERVDPVVDFDWGHGQAVVGLGEDRFSVVWEGELNAEFDEPYTLQVSSDDRARLWLDGHLIIDEWYEHAESVSSAMVRLEAGRRYVVRLEYFENRGRACVSLLWSSPSTPRQVIPQRQLYSTITSAHIDEIRRRYEEEANSAPRLAADSDLPDGWVNQDVGRVGLPGHAVVIDGIWTIAAAGADIWANADGFQFVHRPCDDVVEVVVRVLEQEATDPWAKAGLMVREGLAAGARHLLLAVTPEHGVILVRRERRSESSAMISGPAIGPPCWLKLVRQGGRVAGYVSEDGWTWQWVGTEAFPSLEALHVGMAVNSHDNSRLGEARFDNLTVGRPSEPEPTPEPGGTGTGLQATYFDLETGNLVRRIDPMVDFDWGMGSPVEGIGPDLFSARWEGWIEAPADGVHALHVRSDDGARLWIDDQLVLDAWRDQGAEERTVRVWFEQGKRYPMKLEFYERGGEALIQFRSSSPTLARQPVPSSHLHPPTTHALPPRAAELGEEPAEHERELSQDVAAQLDPECREALAQRISAVRNVSVVAGAAHVNRLGHWENDGAAVYAVDRRGYLEYELTVPSAGIYQLEVEGRSRTRHDLDRSFHLILSVDGERLGRRLLDAGFDESGRVRVLTPWLRAGPHRVGVYWDNARRGRSFELMAVRLQALDGDDVDEDGVADWMRWWLESTCGIETGAGEPVIRSRTSPLCIEGQGRFLSMMTVTVSGEAIEVYPAPGDRWYADVPLSAEGPVEIEVSYQNGGFRELRSVVWEPTNLSDVDDLVVRQGDSLLLTVDGEPAEDGTSSHAMATLEMDGRIVHAGNFEQPYAHEFVETGSFRVSATTREGEETTRPCVLEVHVVGVKPGPAAAGWVGHPRSWEWAGASSERVVVEWDSRVSWTAQSASNPGPYLARVGMDDDEWRYVAGRAGESGTIVGTTSLAGFRLFSSSDTDFEVIETYEDGTDLIEMGLVLSPVRPGVEIEVKLIVGGVVFEDGTVIRRLQAIDFNELGEATVRFLRPALARTSVCHKVTAWEGPVLLGEYR
jgi:regulation of enolase protein 1 (concanavalin A-like superfamily)